MQDSAEEMISEFHALSSYSANLRALVYGVAAWSIEELIGQLEKEGGHADIEGLGVKKKIYIGLALQSQPAIGEVLMKHVLFWRA